MPWTARDAVLHEKTVSWTVRYEKTPSWTARDAVRNERTVSWTVRDVVSYEEAASWRSSNAVLYEETVSWAVRDVVSYEVTATRRSFSAVLYEETVSWTVRDVVSYEEAASWRYSNAVLFEETVSWTVRDVVSYEGTVSRTVRDVVSYDGAAPWRSTNAVLHERARSRSDRRIRSLDRPRPPEPPLNPSGRQSSARCREAKEEIPSRRGFARTMTTPSSARLSPSLSPTGRRRPATLLFLASALASLPALAAGPSVWPESATVKVRPNAAAKAAGTARIAAARNEFEPFQIAIHGGQSGLRGLKVTAGALTGPGGAVIPAEAISLFRVDLLNVTTRSGSIGQTGWWPDPLVPAVDEVDGQTRSAFPFDVPANEARAVWAEVLVPRGAAAGLYRGSVTLTGTDFSAEVPVELEVWNFELPSTPSMASAFLSWAPSICQAHTGKSDCGSVAAAAELAAKYQRLALDHRLTLSNVWVGRDHTADWATFDRYFGPLLDGTAQTRLQGARMTSAQITGTRSVTAFRSWAEHFKAKGWFDRLYDYTADEPPYGSTFDEVKSRAATDAQADPDIPVLVTTNIDGATGYDALDVIDVIVPVVNHIDTREDGDQRQRYEQFEGRGGRVWMYQSCMSHGCGGSVSASEIWPSYMVDVSATRNRLMQWANWRYRVDTELYYETVLAYSENPWSSVYMFSGNGDWTLFYPGTPAKIGGSSQVPVASQRLKLIREGVEDYEYLHLLAQAGDAALADEVARTVLPNAYSGYDDPAKLLAGRERIARRIVELTAGAPADPDAGEETPPDSGSDGPGTDGGPITPPDSGDPQQEPGSGSVTPDNSLSCSAGGRAWPWLPGALLVGASLLGWRRRRHG